MKPVTEKYSSASVILKEDGDLSALVLGDCNSALNRSLLKTHEIMTIVSIGLEASPPAQKLPLGIVHKCYDIHDNIQQKISAKLFDEVVQVIESGRRKGGVLVHCYAGVSRSATFVIAYLMSKLEISYEEARGRTKQGRPCIHPGDGFIRQLQNYYKVLRSRNRQEPAIKLPVEKSEEPLEISPVQPTKKRGAYGIVKCARSPEQSLVKPNCSQQFPPDKSGLVDSKPQCPIGPKLELNLKAESITTHTSIQKIIEATESVKVKNNREDDAREQGVKDREQQVISAYSSRAQVK